MKSNECKVLLASIEGVRKEATLVYEQLAETMKMGLEGVNKHIEATGEVTNLHLQQLTARMDKANGHVADLYKKYEERGKVVEEFNGYKERFERHAKGVKWLKINWWKVLIALCVGTFILILIYDIIGIHKLSELIINTVK